MTKTTQTTTKRTKSTSRSSKRSSSKAQRTEHPEGAEIKEQKEIELKPIPRPKITVYPAELKGSPDVGEHSIDIRSEPFAEIDYEPGSIDYNMRVEGSIHMWTSIGHYDIYA